MSKQRRKVTFYTDATLLVTKETQRSTGVGGAASSSRSISG